MNHHANQLSIILQENENIIIPGIYDPLSAKLAETNGFPAAWVSGFCVSTSLFVPDENHLTIDRYVQRIGEIRKISKIPLIVDCDEGYGSLENACDLVSRLNDIGIEACCLEDNVFPKINSFKETDNRSNLLEDEERFTEKIYAIKKKNPSMLLVARTESLIVGEELPEAVRRARLYQSGGADLLVIHSKSKDINDFIRITEAWADSSSLVVIPTVARDIHLDDLASLGYKIIILANQLLRSTITNMYQVYSKMRNDKRINELNKEIVSMDFIFKLIDSHYNTGVNV